MKNCITRMEIIPNSIDILINLFRGNWFIAVATTIALLLTYFFNHIFPQQRCTKQLPPGSLGFPMIGETISYAGTVKHDKVNEWVKERQSMYGPVFKTSLVGVNTVVMTGSAGNRFILGGCNNGLLNHLHPAALRVIGKSSLSALSGPAHKPVRGAIMSILKLDSIHRYVNVMNSLIQKQLLQELSGKDSVCVTPLMKKLTFKFTCSLLFGLSGDTELEELRKSYTQVLNGTWSFPLNFPGTAFAKAIKARSKISDENIFKDPERFDPTRFENSSAIPPYSYVAFGAGSRVCPGSEFARIQILLILHHMVANYQWGEKCPNERIERGGMPYPTKGLPVKLIPRKL